MKNILKDLFLITEPMGRMYYFGVSIVLCIITVLCAAISYFIQEIKTLPPMLFFIVALVYLLFTLLIIGVIIVVNFVCTSKRFWDIFGTRKSGVIAACILFLLLFLSSSVVRCICYLALSLIPGQTSKRHKDVIKVSDLLDENEKENN